MSVEGYFESGAHPPKDGEFKKDRENSANPDKGNLEEERKVRGKTEIEREKINQQENRKSKEM